MNFESLLDSIPKIENISLPGEASQFKMVPPFRHELLRKQGENIKNAKESAVLALLYPDQHKVAHIALILRKTYNGIHSAQIGLPGGRVEKQDKNLMDTALRETEEEIGIIANTIKVVKRLSRVYIPPSNFYVTPYLGFIDFTPSFTKQEDEVEDILEVKLNDLLDDRLLITKSVSASYKTNVEVPAFNLNNYTVWGATAMMLSELKDILNATL